MPSSTPAAIACATLALAACLTGGCGEEVRFDPTDADDGVSADASDHGGDPLASDGTDPVVDPTPDLPDVAPPEDGAGDLDSTAEVGPDVLSDGPVDELPPTTTLTGFPPLLDERRLATFTFSADEPATFSCSLDEAAFIACQSPLTLEGLAYGTHHFSVRAVDLAGNLEVEPRRYEWDVVALRPANPDCLAPPRPVSSVALEDAFAARGGLPGASIVHAEQAPEDDDHWHLVDRVGWSVLRVAADGSAPATGSAPLFDGAQQVLDLSCFMDPDDRFDFEYGIMGFAFDPAFDGSGRLFVSYTWDHDGEAYAADTRAVLRVARFEYTLGERVDDACIGAGDPCACLAGLQTVVIDRLPRDGVVAGAEARALGNQHYAGDLAFGPDGYLYITFGEGGEDNDTSPAAPYLERPQDPFELFGKLLRIDVNATGSGPDNAYGIPEDNPFGNEVYALGFRNPWRFGVDPETGVVWVADVGELGREEIDRIEAGGNYGWPYREGTVAGPRAVPDGEDPELLEPVLDYDRSQGVSITGGLVYRGSGIPALRGQFLFGDWLDANIRAVVTTDGEPATFTNLVTAPQGVIAFAEDVAGEAYVLTSDGDQLLRLVPGAAAASEFPVLLSQTGCFPEVDGVVAETPTQAMIPFTVHMPLWSDGADKERFLAIPDATTIELEADGDFLLPEGTVLVKNFRVETGRLVETRFFVRHEDGEWAGYTYAWNDEGTDATFQPNGLLRSYDGVEWRFPSSAECLSCHTAGAGRSLGLEVLQLQSHANPAYGGSDFERLLEMGVVASPVTVDLEQIGALQRVESGSGTARDEELALYRAGGPQGGQRDALVRSYLHTNCSGCHRGDDGSVIPQLDFRFGTPLADSAACGALPERGTMGITPAEDARIIAPGSPMLSTLYLRVTALAGGQMPPLARAILDEAATRLIADWITLDVTPDRCE